jgi:hypothetical protein
MDDDLVSRFFDLARHDKDVADDYSAALTEAMEAAILPAIVDVAARHGFQVTTEQVTGYLEGQTAELTDDDLDAVAGGLRAFPLKSSSLVGGLVATAVAVPTAIHGGQKPDRP